jgi:hypothetical protein
VGILRGALLGRKGREGKGRGLEIVAYLGEDAGAGMRVRGCEGARTKVEISYSYNLITLKIRNKPIN